MRSGRTLISILVFLVVSETLNAVPVQDLDGELAALSLDSGLEIYEDPDASAGLADVLRDSDGWRLNRETIPAFGYTRSAFWLRFTVRNDASVAARPLLLLDNEYLDRIDLYELNPESMQDPPLRERVSGRNFPFSTREYKNTGYAFLLDFPPQTAKTIVLRIVSQNTLSIPLSVVHAERHREMVLFRQVRVGFYAGLVLFWFLLNMIFYFAFRDKNFLYYCFYLACTVPIQFALQGVLFQYLWPDWPVWNSHFNTIAATVGFMSGIVFCRQFLNLRLHAPGLDAWFTRGLILVSLAPLLLLISVPLAEAYVGGVTLPIAVALGLLAGWKLFLKGYRPARFYLLAWKLFFIAGIIYTLQVFAILPPRLFGLYMIDYVFLGQFAEILLFPLAIGDRIRTKLHENRDAGIEEPRAQMSRLLRLDLKMVAEKLRHAMQEARVYRSNLTLRKLAVHVGISEKDLSEYLNRELNQSFYEYLHEYRIREARELLIQYPDRKIIEIAYDVGYNNLSTFNRSFLMQTGHTPRDFRRAQVDSASSGSGIPASDPS